MNSKMVFYYMRIFVAIAAFFFSQLTFSQGLKVKEFKQNLNDGSAFNAPMDDQGHPCGLIKVRTDVAELKFKGDVVGEVENKMNEYWVYMAQGCKQLGILHPNFLPMSVDFGDYGIGEVDSKATYVMTLNETKFNKEKCGLLITVKPETATLNIDYHIVENLNGNGYYQLYLPKGNHLCQILQKGYRPFVLSVNTGKETQNLNVELESVMAKLEIKCRTETAEIYVDGNLKGNGTWKGDVFAGEHRIEAKLQNFESFTQTVSVAEKESRTFVIPQLKRAKGKVRIETVPTNLPVNIDSEDVGMSPCTVDVETGTHFASCKSYGVRFCRKEFDISQGDFQTIRLELVKDAMFKEEIYSKAYNGDVNAINELAYRSLTTPHNAGSDEEAAYWYEKSSNIEDLFTNMAYDYYNCNWFAVFISVGKPEKALEVYELLKKHHGLFFSSATYLDELGYSYLKKKDVDKAIDFFNAAVESEPNNEYGYGFEGLGDCYRAKGNMQLAASYYRKYLNTIDRMHPNWRNDSMYYSRFIEKVEKKLKELGYY